MSSSIYTTSQGDTLGAVAQRSSLDWRSIFHAGDNDELRELLRSPEVALPADTPVWLTDGAPAAVVTTRPDQTLSQVCSANGVQDWRTVFENPSNGLLRYLCVDPSIALRAGLEIRIPAPGRAHAATEGKRLVQGQDYAFELSGAGLVSGPVIGTSTESDADATSRSEAGANGGASAGEGEVSQEIQAAWRAATGEIVGRLDAMSKQLDAMSPPLATKATIQELLRSFSEMLSAPMETVWDARAVYEFITTDPLIESVLEPILAKIAGVVADEGSTGSDDASTEGDGVSGDTAEDGSRASAGAGAGEAEAEGSGGVSQEIQATWRAATGEIVGRLDAMSKQLDAMSPPLATKAAIQELLRSFSEMLSAPMETVWDARAVYEFITTDPLVGQIEGSSLIEPKVEIEGVLEPILAKIAGVVADEGSTRSDDASTEGEGVSGDTAEDGSSADEAGVSEGQGP